MMMYINMFSSAFTALGLIVNLEVLSVWAFLTTTSILLHIGVMAIQHGDRFISTRSSEFAPLSSDDQTVRQLSIVLSILLFRTRESCR